MIIDTGHIAITDTTHLYNGNGDWLQQTVDGTTTNYTLDLNSGLTLVLATADETYLYGLDRLGYGKNEGMLSPSCPMHWDRFAR